MSNPNNTGTLIGRLARDPQVFENKDGSKKVLFTVYADRNYKSADGSRPSDAISVEVFVSNRVNGTTPYEMVHQGDLVALSTTLQANSYEKDGGMVYETKVVAEEIQFLEPRKVTQDRLAARVNGQATSQQGAVPADAPAFAQPAATSEEAGSAVAEQPVVQSTAGEALPFG